jgi:hypothetical protein
MGRNRVFRNSTTTDASRFTYYKKSIEQFKFARNKPISKPTDNFKIDYTTDEITSFQTYDNFRSLATGFYATKIDCSMNKTVPMSIGDGILSGISYEELIEFHEDPFYTEAAAAFNIQWAIDPCKYAKGTLYPYGQYVQNPVTNQFNFPAKISINSCDPTLSYGDAIAAIGMRTINPETGNADGSRDVGIGIGIEFEVAGVGASLSDESGIPDELLEGKYDRDVDEETPAGTRETTTTTTAQSGTTNLYVYPRTTNFAYYGQTNSTELPVSNASETRAHAYFPRFAKESTMPDGFINVQGELRPYFYSTPFTPVKTNAPVELFAYGTQCELDSGKLIENERVNNNEDIVNSILNRGGIETRAGTKAVASNTRGISRTNTVIPSPASASNFEPNTVTTPSTSRTEPSLPKNFIKPSTRQVIKAPSNYISKPVISNTSTATGEQPGPNFPPNPLLGKRAPSGMPAPTAIPTQSRTQPQEQSTRAGLISSIMSKKGKGCSRCR